jgi:hypothetical protein
MMRQIDKVDCAHAHAVPLVSSGAEQAADDEPGLAAGCQLLM